MAEVLVIDLFIDAAGSIILPLVTQVQTSGYSAVGDGGGASFVPVDSEPSHPAKFQSDDGRWWEIAAGLRYTAEMFGAVGDGIVDDAPAIDAGLAAPMVDILLLGSKTYSLAAGIRIPSGKGLEGVSPDLTVLLAASAFGSTSNPVLVGFAANGTDQSLRNLTVDVAKIGIGGTSSERCNGSVAEPGCRNYLRENLVVRNFTGYGVYDAGPEDLSAPPGGRNVNIWTFNGQVHYEPQAVNGVYYQNCHARDGDGDIICLQWFHPLVGAQNVHHINCDGFGQTGAAINPTANLADLNNITFVDCWFHVTGNGIGLALTAGELDTRNLHLTNVSLYSESGFGALLHRGSGTFSQVRIRGWGVGIESYNSDFEFTSCDVTAAYPADATATVTGIIGYGNAPDGGYQIRMNGGALNASGPANATLRRPLAGSVQVSAFTMITPPPPGRAIANQYLGQSSAIQGAAPNSYAVVNLPFSISDWSKVHVTPSIKRATHDGVYLPGPVGLNVSPYLANAIIVRVTGANLSTGGWIITAEVTEWI